MRWFVLQAADPETGCPALETRFAVEDAAALRDVLGRDADNDPELEHTYRVEDDDLALISARFDVPFDGGGREVSLEPWHRLRELPYLVQTGFELPLMLEGRKPLAVFGDAAAWLEKYLSAFDPFVADGRIVKRVIDRSDILPDSIEVYFVLPGEEWRIDAYIDLFKEAAKSGWSEAMERRQGVLLGYTDWENDCWVKWRAGLRA